MVVEGNHRKPLYEENSSRDWNKVVPVGGGSFLHLAEGGTFTGLQIGAGSAVIGEERQELKHRGTTRLFLIVLLVMEGTSYH